MEGPLESTTFWTDALALSADVLSVLGLVAVVAAVFLSTGKDRLVAWLLALYPATLLTIFFPYYELVSLGEGSLATILEPLIIFVVSGVVFGFILRNYVETNYQHSFIWRFAEVTILSFMTVGLFLAVLYHVVEIEQYYDFSVVLDTLFRASGAFFVWLLLPLASFPLFLRP